MAVAGQELLDAQRAGAMVRADAARRRRSRARSARTRRRMKARIRISLSSLSVCTSASSRSRSSSITSPVLGAAQPHQAAAAREHVHFAGELAGRCDDDELVAGRRRAQNVQRAAGDDEERRVGAADLEQDLAAAERAAAAVRRDARNLGRRQRRERLFGPRDRRRRGRDGGIAHLSMLPPRCGRRSPLIEVADGAALRCAVAPGGGIVETSEPKTVDFSPHPRFRGSDCGSHGRRPSGAGPAMARASPRPPAIAAERRLSDRPSARSHPDVDRGDRGLPPRADSGRIRRQHVDDDEGARARRAALPSARVGAPAAARVPDSRRHPHGVRPGRGRADPTSSRPRRSRSSQP